MKAFIGLFLLGACGLLQWGQACPQVDNYTEPEAVEEFISPLFGGRTEVRLWDGVRVDVLTPDHAIEVDWAKNWHEGVGQALLYSEFTGLEPGLVLLVPDWDADSRHIYRAQVACARAGVRLWRFDMETETLR